MRVLDVLFGLVLLFVAAMLYLLLVMVGSFALDAPGSHPYIVAGLVVACAIPLTIGGLGARTIVRAIRGT